MARTSELGLPREETSCQRCAVHMNSLLLVEPQPTRRTKLVRGLLVVVPALLAAMIFLWIPMNVTRAPRSLGEAAFLAADRQIAYNRGRIAFGNSAQAVTVAAEFSRAMKASWKQPFDEADSAGASEIRRRVLTHCELHPAHCILLVQFSELHRMTADAKLSLQTIAWEQAQAALRTKNAGTNGMKLVLGLGDLQGYDTILTGRFALEVSSDAGRMNSVEFSPELISGYFEEALKSKQSNRSKPLQ